MKLIDTSESKVAVTRLCLQGTGALGDSMMLSAVAKSLKGAGYEVVAVLPKHFASLLVDSPEIEAVEYDESDADYDVIVDLKNYLSGLVPWVSKTERIKEGEDIHLVNWMIRAAESQLPNNRFRIDRSNVELLLSKNELSSAKEKLNEIRKGCSSKSLFLVAPYANSRNRSLSASVLDTVSELVANEIKLVELVGPKTSPASIKNAIALETPDAREMGALAVAADGILAVDSGPFHVMCAGLQSVSQRKMASPEEAGLEKIILVLGSSSTDIVSYEGVQNHVIESNCSIAPCHAHGYVSPDKYSVAFGKKFFPQSDKNASACIFEEYSAGKTTTCMNLDPKVLADKMIRLALQTKR